VAQKIPWPSATTPFGSPPPVPELAVVPPPVPELAVVPPPAPELDELELDELELDELELDELEPDELDELGPDELELDELLDELPPPHTLSVGLQTPLRHTAIAAPVVHMPVRGGVWPVTVGIGVLSASLGVHVDDCVLHHWAEVQSVSTWQGGVHTPLVVSHTPDLQTATPFAAVQGPVPLA
jgi:hypothetical protein